jgi:hypothetical protein
MKKQYNVIVDDADIRRVEEAVPGAKGGTALRIAALMYARQAAGGESSDTVAEPADNGEGGVS